MKKGRILVTGGCGFIGREVVKQLLEKGYSVIIVDNFSNSVPLEESSSLRVIKIDLTKSEGILEIFNKVDSCIHLAASVGGVKYMNSYQSKILRDNILIDSNTIYAASQTDTKIVYVSTVMVYDNLNPPFKEDQVNIPPPKSNYAFSKLIGERLCQAFSKDKNLTFTIARLSNVYGINPNKILQERLHVIPDLIRKVLKSNILELIGGGRQIRSFVHVSDVANALILIMEKQLNTGEIFNVASKERYKIVEVAKIIWKLLRKKEPFQISEIDLKGEDLMDSSTDSSKIHKMIGWVTKKNLKDSLPEIIKWYQKEYEK